MQEMRAISEAELLATDGEVVPQRETLALVNLANLASVNIALAVERGDDPEPGQRLGRPARRHRPVLGTCRGRTERDSCSDAPPRPLDQGYHDDASTTSRTTSACSAGTRVPDFASPAI